MASLGLAQASDIVDAALEKAVELGLRPVTVTVLDPGGHPVVIKRQDGAGILRPQIAHAKAWGSLGMGHGGGHLAERADRGPAGGADAAVARCGLGGIDEIDAHHARCVREAEAAENDAIHDAELGGHGADAEGQHENRERGG